MLSFRDARDWHQFHTPENLAKSVAIESGELLECFQWNGDYNKVDVADEMADVFSYLLLLADETGIDLEQAFYDKLAKTELKYPVDKAKGNSRKYDQYE